MKIKQDWYKKNKYCEGEIAFVTHIVKSTDYLTYYRSLLYLEVNRYDKPYGRLLSFWFDIGKEEGIYLNLSVLNFSIGIGLFSIYVEGNGESNDG